MDVKIYWNTKRALTQLIILLCVGLFWVFGEGTAIRNFCIAAAFLDIASVFFTSLVGGTADISDISPDVEKAAEKKASLKKPSIQTQATQTATSIPDEEIPNRVGVPTQQAQPVQQEVFMPEEPEPTSEPTVEPIQEMEVQEPAPAEPEYVPEEVPDDGGLDAMSDEQWADLFHF